MMQAAFGIVMDMGGSFSVGEFDIGRHKTEYSYARLLVEADDEELLQSIVHELHQNGANPADPKDAKLTPAPGDQVVPTGFYSTTNHPTFIRYEGRVARRSKVEMDCAVVVEDGESPRAYTKVLNAVEAGDLIVTGETGIKGRTARTAPRQGGRLRLYAGRRLLGRPSVSTIHQIADAIEETKQEGGKVLAVCGPALIHSGAREDLARLVDEGFVDMISAGNGYAVHDLERDLYGTSLGMDTESLDHPRKGHKHHIYTISGSSGPAASNPPSTTASRRVRRDVRVRHQRRSLRAGGVHPRRRPAARHHHRRRRGPRRHPRAGPRCRHGAHALDAAALRRRRELPALDDQGGVRGHQPATVTRRA